MYKISKLVDHWVQQRTSKCDPFKEKTFMEEFRKWIPEIFEGNETTLKKIENSLDSDLPPPLGLPLRCGSNFFILFLFFEFFLNFFFFI